MKIPFNIDAAILCHIELSLLSISVECIYARFHAHPGTPFACLPACILLRHFSIYIYDIDVTRYYLNSYLSCSFFAPGIPFSIDICVPRTHFDWVYNNNIFCVFFFFFYFFLLHRSSSMVFVQWKKNIYKMFHFLLYCHRHGTIHSLFVDEAIDDFR